MPHRQLSILVSLGELKLNLCAQKVLPGRKPDLIDGLDLTNQSGRYYGGLYLTNQSCRYYGGSHSYEHQRTNKICSHINGTTAIGR